MAGTSAWLCNFFLSIKKIKSHIAQFVLNLSASWIDIALQGSFGIVYEKDSEVFDCPRLPLICMYPNMPSRGKNLLRELL